MSISVVWLRLAVVALLCGVISPSPLLGQGTDVAFWGGTYMHREDKQQKQEDEQPPKGANPSKVYEVCDEAPEFPGGMSGINKFVLTHSRHYEVHACPPPQGRVIVAFVVMPNGAITEARILRGVNDYLDKEAMRLLKAMPRWKPGKVGGRAVACRVTIPIVFRLY